MENKHNESDNESAEKELKLIGITYNQIESGVYALVLQEIEGQRRIPIVIGYPEAQAIECKLQEVITPRPLTHDLIAVLFHSLGAVLEKVVIRRLSNGVFAAYMHIRDFCGREIQLDSRSSDAVAIAIRVGAPIYTTERVLREAGFLPDENRYPSRRDAARGVRVTATSSEVNPDVDADVKDGSGKFRYEGMTRNELTELMQRCVDSEDYEQAAEIKKFLESDRL